MTLCMIFLDSGGLKFDWTINLGNVIGGLACLLIAVRVWRDFHWRVKNIEDWQEKHDLHTEKQDEIIERLDRILIRMEQFIGMTDQRKMGTVQTRKDD
jgi:hypothetical protein